jgi:hypothetical protein
MPLSSECYRMESAAPGGKMSEFVGIKGCSVLGWAVLECQDAVPVFEVIPVFPNNYLTASNRPFPHLQPAT